MKLLICDLDGVVVKNEARFHRASENAAGLTGRAWADAFWGTMFTPELVALDRLIPGSDDALDLLQEAGFTIVFLTSRPHTMRDATVAWLSTQGVLIPGRELIMKNVDEETERYRRTDEWKALCVHKLVAELIPDFVLFIDDEPKNRDKVSGLLVYTAHPTSWLLTDSLFSDAVRALITPPKEVL